MALTEALDDVLAKSSRAPAKSKLRTIHRFLDCFELKLIPFISTVAHALGAALNFE